jgi:hypothetical protein
MKGNIMENNVYNSRRSGLVDLLATVIKAAHDKGKAGEAFSQDSIDRVAYDVVGMVERLCHERERDVLAAKLVIDPVTIPAEVFDNYLHWESKFRSEDEGGPVELLEVIADLTRDTIRHNLKAEGYKVWGAVNGHELYGMEGESSAYAQHSDSCGCLWLSDGDEPWEPMGDW